MQADLEAIIGTYLRDHALVKALNAHVVGEPPVDKGSRPWVQVLQLDPHAVEDHRSDHLIEWMAQYDCYASAKGGQQQASELARAVRAALAEASHQTFEEIVVTGARFVSCPRIPDLDLEPARQRFVLTAVLVYHAK
jgi:hypothetical protein